MLRKSVETRDWLNTIEPRNVRAVMKRVVEDVTCIDSEVGRLYEEGVRRDRSSDSTKRSYTSRPATRSNWSFTPRSVQGFKPWSYVALPFTPEVRGEGCIDTGC